MSKPHNAGDGGADTPADAAPVRAIVLAAGKGTRMDSDLPKVLHDVGGEPMVVRIVRSARAAGASGAVVVVGYGADQVEAAVREAFEGSTEGTGHDGASRTADASDMSNDGRRQNDFEDLFNLPEARGLDAPEAQTRPGFDALWQGPDNRPPRVGAPRSGASSGVGASHGSDDFELQFAEQAEQLGTAHAVQCALPALAEFDGWLLILNGDVPNLTAESLRRLIALGTPYPDGVAFITTEVDDPTGYGRVVRDDAGDVTEIVEHDDCTPEQLEVDEINAGMYLAHADFVREHLGEIEAENAQHEFYLTDLIALAAEAGGARALKLDDPREVEGVNTVEQLEAARAVAAG